MMIKDGVVKSEAFCYLVIALCCYLIYLFLLTFLYMAMVYRLQICNLHCYFPICAFCATLTTNNSISSLCAY